MKANNNRSFLQQPKSIAFALLGCMSLGLFSGVLNAAAEKDAQALQRQIDAERKRLDAMEAQLEALQSADGVKAESRTDQEAAAKSDRNNSKRQLIAAEGRDDPYLDEKFIKSSSLTGSPWRFSFGGYAKLDILHDFSGTGSKQELVLSSIPVDNNPSEGSYSRVQISETRFHFETRNSDSKHDNSVFFEFDFFDNEDNQKTRLRHAYVRYGQLLAGRTWTLLTELRQLPLILDFAAGDSLLGGRTEQLRWTTLDQSETLGWAVALEHFDDTAVYNPDDLTGVARSDFPRLAAGFTKLWDGGVWSTGGAVTQLRFDGNDGVSDSTEAAYTVTTAGRIYLDNDQRNWFGLGLGYQSGSITDVLTFANGRVPNASIDSNGDLELAKGWNTQLGLHWQWSDRYSSNFNYAYAKITNVPELFDPDFIRIGSAFHANLIYKYDKYLSLGVEVMHGERENVSGRDGDAQRIQFSTIYYF